MNSLIKSSAVSLASFCAAASLFAQSEPQKAPPLGSSPSPGSVNRSESAPQSGNPPPPVTTGASSAGDQAASTEDLRKAKPVDAANNDPSVKPADDFFLYANGGWIKRTEIPPEYSRWGSSNQLIEQNNDALHEIAEKASKTKVDASPSRTGGTTAPEVQKVGDYYASGMNEKTIDQMRIKPLQDELAKIDSIKDRKDVLRKIAHLHSIGVTALFGFGSGIDDKNSTMTIANAVQGGLGMPDRDYYTKQDADMKDKREKYVAHVTKMLTLLGQPPEKAAEDAKKK